MSEIREEKKKMTRRADRVADRTGVLLSVCSHVTIVSNLHLIMCIHA